MEKYKITRLISRDAKEIVDLLFDMDYLNPKLTRDSMSAFEEYLKTIITSRVNNSNSLFNLNTKISKTLGKNDSTV